MKFWLINSFFICSCSFIGYSQVFADKEHYLVDSLRLERLSKIDIQLLDSSLIQYYKATHDTSRIRAFEIVIDNSRNEYLTSKYNDYIYYFAEKKLAVNLNLEVKNWYLNSLANAANNKSYYLTTKGKHNEAFKYCNNAMTIFNEVNNNTGVAACLLGLGDICKNKGEPANALKFYIKSLKIFEREKNLFEIAKLYNNIGFMNINQGAIKKGIAFYQKSLKIKEKIGDKFSIAASLNNLGYVYRHQGETDLALEYYEKALKTVLELEFKRGIAICLNNIGSIHQERQKLNKALDYYEKSLNVIIEMGNKAEQAKILVNIGSIYADQRNSKKALEYYQKTLSILESSSNKWGLSTCLDNIGQIYYREKQLDLARHYTTRSLASAKIAGYPDKIKQPAQSLAKIYKKLGMYEKALDNYELYILMRDSIQNKVTERAAIKQNLLYEYEKKSAADSIKAQEQQKVLDAQIIAQEAQLAQEKTIKYSLFGGLGLVALFSLFVTNRLKITRKQKEEIEIKNVELNERNIEIANQKEIVEDKNKQVIDSINYAERIQSAILPPIALIKEILPESFVLYKPKDIVAGDFYWLEQSGNDVFFAAADCTGHGVPGAMMSVMCSNALTKCVNELRLGKPSDILDATTNIIEGTFERSEQLVLDGMDLALCKLNLSTNVLEYAGANNPLWVVRDEEILETKADKQPIGLYDYRTPYSNHVIELKKGDCIYIFSDGFVDQFGGARGKKFKAKPFKQLLLLVQNEPMDKQKELINQSFEDWMGAIEQVDDVCIIGVKI